MLNGVREEKIMFALLLVVEIEKKSRVKNEGKDG